MKFTVPQRIFLKLVKNPFVKLHINLKHHQFLPQDALILTGDPRSGTTWMSEVIAAEEGVTVIIEPLSLRRKHMVDLGFTWRMFIEPNQNSTEIKAYFDDLLTGQVINGMDRHQTPLSEIWRTKRWLIKFVRANRLLPWLVEQYQFTNKPLHLIRHPCGVIYSQMKHHAFDPAHEVAAFDQAWINKYRPDLKPLLTRLKSEVQIRALTWALDNYIPLRYWSPDKWLTYSYEELVLNSETKLEDIYKNWNREVPEKVLGHVTQRSGSTYDWAQFEESGRKRLGAWKDYLTAVQITEILEVVHAVGLPEFTEEIEPDYDLLYRRHE